MFCRELFDESMEIGRTGDGHGHRRRRLLLEAHSLCGERLGLDEETPVFLIMKTRSFRSL